MRIPAGADYIVAILVMLGLGIGASLADRPSDPTSLIDLFEELSAESDAAARSREPDASTANP